MPKLTKKIIDSQPHLDKTFYVWDTEIKGFGCQVLPSGRKTYYFMYRNSQKKLQRLKVGVHGNITCEIAREIVQGWAGDVARSKDPKEDRKKMAIQEKKVITLREFSQIYMKKHAEILKKPSSAKEDQGLLNSRILPAFGHKKISEITREDIVDLQESLKNYRVRGNRCVALLSIIFNLAEEWGFIEKGSSPCYKIKKTREHHRQTFLTEDEIQKLEEIMKAEETLRSLSPYGLAAIRLLLYTGCRSKEILRLQWDDVFLEESYIQLKDSKGGKRQVVLNEPTKAAFRKLEQQEGNLYVFIGKNPGKPLYDARSQWKKVSRLIGFKGVRIHDLRHTFASLAIKQGLDIFYVSKLLGHKNIQTTQRYAHLARDDLIRASNEVSKIFSNK